MIELTRQCQKTKFGAFNTMNEPLVECTSTMCSGEKWYHEQTGHCMSSTLVHQGTTHCSIQSSECGIDVWDAGGFLLPANEIVRLISHVRDIVSKALGVVDEGNGNQTWVLSRGENSRTSVLYFTLFWRLFE